MTETENKKALIIDSGLYVHVAEMIALGFGETYYFADWRGQFPTSKLSCVGEGLGLERVQSWEEWVDKVDIIIFLDIYYGHLQSFLRARGYRVWGNADAEVLETDRWKTKQWLGANGSAINRTYHITGLHGKEGLVQHLKQNDDRYIKGGRYRGDFESYHHENLWLTKPWIDELQNTLGPRQDIAEFIVEDPINGVECGFDGFSIDGVFPSVGSYGYECKDAGYVGKVYDRPPKIIEKVCQELSSALKGYQARGFLSIEFRVGEDKVPYIIDPCMRCGSPPSETYIEMFSNWSDVIWAGADGELIDLVPAAQYGAQLVLKADWAKENWLAVDVPKDMRKFVKLHNHYRLKDMDYVVPNGIKEIGGVIGLGDTLEEAIKQCLENAEEVKAYSLEFDRQCFDKCMDQIEEGIQNGIDW